MKNRSICNISILKNHLKHGATEQRRKIGEQSTNNFFETFSFGSTCFSCRVLISPLLRCSVLFGLALFVSGCTLAKVDVNVVSERTSLENQVLGTYNSLSEDMLLVASVRGVSPTGKVEAPPHHTRSRLMPPGRWRRSRFMPMISKASNV